MNIRYYLIITGVLITGTTFLVSAVCHSGNPHLKSLQIFTAPLMNLFLVLETVIEKKKLYIFLNLFIPSIIILYKLVSGFRLKKYLPILRGFLACIVMVTGLTYYFYEAVLNPLIPENSRSRDFGMYYLGALGVKESHNFYYDYAYYIRDKRQDHSFIVLDGVDPDPGYLDRQLAAHGMELIPPYTYPPLWYIMCLPLLAFTWITAFDVFMIFNQFCLATALICLPIDQTRKIPPADFCLISGLLFYFYPLIRTVNGGQANLVVLALITISLLLIKHQKEWTAGAFLALATAIKLHPLILIGYCLMKKKYRVFYSAVIWILILMILSTVFVGWQIMKVYYLEVLPKWASNMRAHDMNVSIAGFVSRLFIGYRWLTPPFHNPALARTIVTLSALSILIAIAILFYKRKTTYIDCFNMEFSIVIIATALVSTWTLDHHLVLLLIPFAVLLQYRQNDSLRWGKMILLLLAYSLISWRYHYWEPFYRQGLGTLLLSIRTGGIICLMAAALYEYLRYADRKEKV
ncbi:MAG: hypothetical protein A2161_02815 [Candidatus Schekmanbacteria bacterium RBG_13_48_7]|uniref:DUF2029 domain-containing protein n=1 Tax=Candidatus Schekmanbacteria bacterium RBG_13_48_7 TaxID=1817878 RepID=A0A1F7RS34_9BACT|nr:MAG: hypothetical protein A2161_02815 [Candidatus Schekmanbacteria bacterium RBG_13_48_7]